MVKTKQTQKEKLWTVDKNGRLRIIHKNIIPPNNKKVYLIYYKIPSEDLTYGESGIRIRGFTSKREYHEFIEDLYSEPNSEQTCTISLTDFKKMKMHSS